MTYCFDVIPDFGSGQPWPPGTLGRWRIPGDQTVTEALLWLAPASPLVTRPYIFRYGRDISTLHDPAGFMATMPIDSVFYSIKDEKNFHLTTNRQVARS